MRTLRPSLRSIIRFVAIIALDLALMLNAVDAAILGTYSHGEMAPEVFIMGVPLMAGILIAYLVIMLWELWQRGECPAFLVGFQVFGWAPLWSSLVAVAWTNRVKLPFPMPNAPGLN